ncbi:unnamed protein product [Linum trigynum]|uniref:RNase H type-1 domain-containing protein n=1 Tax=Linum trigynum TaxID=586398 RepID=A0AAV2CGV0_9ROSI
MQLIPPSECQQFFRTGLQDWILSNLRNQHRALEFGVTCWSLWRTRNDRVFEGKIITLEAFLHRVRAWIPIVRTALDKDKLIHKPSLPARTEEMISWKPPPPEWVCLNPDGSVIHDTGLAAAGGLIRDHTGRCLTAFALNLRACTITQAELRGVVERLQVVCERGYRRVRVQLDSKCAVHLIRQAHTGDHHCGSILDRFRDLMSRPWEVTIEHIYREGNCCADYLASRGHVLPFGLHEVENSDPMLSYWIMYDCQGISEPWLVLNER